VTAPTREEVLALISVTRAVADAVRELGRVPSGHLYASVMSTLSYENYTWVIERLKGAKLIREDAHELIWIGPCRR
jgi:hypothetical protein